MKRKRYITCKNTTKEETSQQPSCPICLQTYTNRTFVRDCFHSFCFVCIRQWINITPDCPLCKRPIRALIYNIVEEANTYQEYRLADKKPNTTKHHPPSTSTRQELRPWLERRRALYRQLWPVITYPPALPRFASFTILQPEHMPKIIPFLQSELQALLGSAYDTFIETHIQTILLIPYHRRKSNVEMTMYDDAVIQPLTEWLAETDQVTRRWMDELLAYLKSGLSYMHFINTAQYNSSEDNSTPPH
ncbi:uncharacterized protein BX664DRAFT_324191 [Halteromyces radiatus]|uniref:uncharacterized protein n=1 Tax=Halteromyces radiatus TaxID=101107 RepID=UPI00221FC2DB|nr:uncharacterized protein BX664DRAFT_324191 [Halteromyces radiatus]KAI8096527.1 hypothetical protein BX664DRAFT_324191 [Halteromyces radiatus]